MTTIEGNKLIIESDFVLEIHQSWLASAKKDKCEDYFISNLKYHSSWEWLMPVVDKIGVLSPYIISPDTMRISDAGVVYKSKVSTIDAVWNACLLYIQWHNARTSHRH